MGRSDNAGILHSCPVPPSFDPVLMKSFDSVPEVKECLRAIDTQWIHLLTSTSPDPCLNRQTLQNRRPEGIQAMTLMTMKREASLLPHLNEGEREPVKREFRDR